MPIYSGTGIPTNRSALRRKAPTPATSMPAHATRSGRTPRGLRWFLSGMAALVLMPWLLSGLFELILLLLLFGAAYKITARYLGSD